MGNQPERSITSPVEQASAQDHPLRLDGERLFETCFNRRTFGFRHELSDDPRFGLSSLIRLAERLSKRDAVYWSNGAVGVSDRWETGTERRQPLMDTLENIARNDSLVMLRSIVHDPELGPVVRHCLSVITGRVGPALRDDATGARATVLIASPHRITAYHIDSDVNFLMQVAGKKQFHVYDHSDPTLITAEELERYFSGDANGARYKPERLSDAVTYELDAGLGAHVPCMAPHWAKNGDDISIAVSFNFDLRSIERTARLHKVNRRLRRLGMLPKPPGTGVVADQTKLALYRMYDAAHRMLAPVRAANDGEAWDLHAN
jgi:hypothetical protein